MCRFIAHTGNDMHTSNLEFQQLKHIFRIINIDLKHTRIRIALSKYKNQFFSGIFFFEPWKKSRRYLRKQSVSECLCLSAHLSHINRRAKNENVDLCKRTIQFLHIIVDNTLTALQTAQTTLAVPFIMGRIKRLFPHAAYNEAGDRQSQIGCCHGQQRENQNYE